MLLVATTMAWAQGEKKQLTLIPKVGLNYSTTNLSSWVGKDAGEGKPDVKGLVGPVAGVEAEYAVSEKLGLSAGLLYSMQGRKFDNYATRLSSGRDAKNLSIIDTQHHHYVNIPLTANYYIIPGLAVRAGVQMGVLVYKSGTEDVLWADGWRNHKLGSSPKKLDLSIPVGVSYALKNGLQFDLRYNFGLNGVSTDGGTTKENSRVLQFTVGYRLKLLTLK